MLAAFHRMSWKASAGETGSNLLVANLIAQIAAWFLCQIPATIRVYVVKPVFDV